MSTGLALKGMLMPDAIEDAQRRFWKKNALRHDPHCDYCDKRLNWQTATVDHITPRSKGGASGHPNFALACFPCNNRKEDLTPEQAKMPLLRRRPAP
jgi:5-methylcytosine-specific restriction endonuclease McrA